MAEGKTLRRVGPALFVVVLTVFLQDLPAAEFEYTVADGKLFVFGYQLEPQFPVKASRPREDDDALIGFNSSPSERWMLIQVGESMQTELWLYDRQRNTRPVKVDVRPCGRHVFASGRNDEVFEVQHAGMGYSESDFFQADDLKKNKHRWSHLLP